MSFYLEVMTKKVQKVFRKFNKPLFIVGLSLVLFIFIDISRLDSYIYKLVCLSFKLVGLNPVCPDFYDLPFWEVGATLGTLFAAYSAYVAIRDSDRRLAIEQTPHVVMSDRVFLADKEDTKKLHVIYVKNVGRGSALSITAFADCEAKISIIEGSNPHSIDLVPGESKTNWAIDEKQTIKGLKLEGKQVKKSVFEELPDEMSLSDQDKSQSDFYLYLRYLDQLGNIYQTQSKFRKSGHFLKLMENKVTTLSK